MTDPGSDPDAEPMQMSAASISKVFVVKEYQIHTLLVAFSSSLYGPIEDVPGVGKTALARCPSVNV